MPSSYPGGLDSFATNKANATATATDHPNHHNDLADAVNKIEAELGIDPAGALATVRARLDAIEGAVAPIVRTPDTAESVASVTDVTVFSEAVAGLAVGDVLEVEIWGFINNGTGQNRTIFFTLDFDDRFDSEWAINSVSTVQGWKMIAKVVIEATNKASLALHQWTNAQSILGQDNNQPVHHYRYDLATDDLTGSTTVALKARADAANAPHSVTVQCCIIKKLTTSA